ncbi:GTP cyclohydrolase [Flavobacterium sp. TP390]|uniref:GTP cyclohydrolase n=1 Tax=Flavobacterium profundi TaxID=1774945 RepID=A0A6I4IV21_9FLAO|nr:GTP cyclohydrolase [Flavobacterium profundi]MVO10665.1 GTP cyclohydrolase [Flavobacterium profundi]
MITVKKVSSKKELKEYVLFSFELFKDNPNWIPPIIAEELETFDKTKNPAFHSAEAHFYLAYKEGKIVGKLAAIINWDEVKILKKSKVRFGWFDVIDDIEVTKALLEKVYELGRQHHLEMVEGPIGFSNLDKVGVLVEGFEEMGNMVTWYSMPYYKDHFEQLGLVKEKEYVESSFSFTNIDPAPFMKISKLIQERYQLRAINFTKTKDIMPYVDEMFDLFNETYAKLQSFVAINQVQKEYFKKKYISFINPEYIKFILDKDDKMVAFAIVMPGFSDALKKAKGKLFPFGFYHLLQARKHSKEAVFYLIGVTPEYQSKGITAIIFEEYYKIFKAKDINTCVRTPELEENNAIHNLWKHFNSKITKRRRTYSKKL